MPRGVGVSSTSSVWGSAGVHFTEYGDRRFLIDAASVSETKISVKIDNQNDMLTGSRNVVCSTEAEYKANKMNRTEQTKLEHLQRRVAKEKATCQRRFNQIEQTFRAKSAKLIERSKSVETRISRPSSLRSNWKPLVTIEKPPSSASGTKSRCELCDKIQEAIGSYELENGQISEFEHVTDGDHSTCMFSDAQMHTFLDVLRMEYLNEAPDLHGKLRRMSGTMSKEERQQTFNKRSLEEIDHTMAAKNIEIRIRRFCVEMDKYNKEHVAIPAEVRDTLEKVRLAGAIATPRTRQLSSRTRRRQEVKELLKS